MFEAAPRRRAFAACGLALAAGIACVPWNARAQANGAHTVEVFVNSAMVVTAPRVPPYQVTIHRMDQLDMATRAIDQLIPRGGEELARRWVAANEARIKRQVQPAAIATANAIGLANHYRLDRLPAVVVNRRTVVYGVLDVETALQHYRAASRGTP
jgi:integrating conjugative element protein (TIGR03757 family)